MLNTTKGQCWRVQLARLLLSAMALFVTMVAAQPTGGQSAPNGSVGADLGTGWNILQIPAIAFANENPLLTTPAYSNLGYIYSLSSLANTPFYAPVYLPSGAAIGFLDLYAYDTGSGTIVANLRRYTGYGGVPQCSLLCPSVAPATSVVVSVSSIGNSGYQYVSSNELTPPHTVNNDVRYGGGAQYVVEVNLPESPVYAFKGVDIWWKRQISPAPGVARFSDVPLGAQFFAEIEALAASGITLGCTATTFCPNANLTRAQMAAFLARALGLYYQY